MDLIREKDTKIDNQVITYYQRHFPHLSFAPLIFTSAETGRNVDKILDLVLEVEAEKHQEISEKKLERILKKLVKKHRPAQAKGKKHPYIYNLKQTWTNPPEFTITVGQDQSVHSSYLKFIENQLRQNFGFLGVPVKIKVREIKR